MDQSIIDATKRDRKFIAGLGPKASGWVKCSAATAVFTSMNLKAVFVRSIRQESVAAGN
jgi:hypothetical protein